MQKYSQEYLWLIEEYKNLHQKGVNKITASQTFKGRSLEKWIIIIRDIVIRYKINSLIDFGCGKAHFYFNKLKLKDKITKQKKIYKNVTDYWGIKDYVLYDPGVIEFSKFPNSQKDLVICTDVMEHIPSQDTIKLLTDIYELANKAVFFAIEINNVSNKTLSDGRDVHINLREKEEWNEIFKNITKKFPKIHSSINFVETTRS
tara:strand:+ start:183 stop:791 length:609 start_codon:yes stop_codon:yes gene_type:complete